MSVAFVYYTAASRDDVLQIGRVLVEEHLAACINVLGEITSIYRWEGAIEEAQEVSALVKTTESKLPVVIERVQQLHKYDCPCVVSWPITQGNAKFLNWIEAETQP